MKYSLVLNLPRKLPFQVVNGALVFDGHVTFDSPVASGGVFLRIGNRIVRCRKRYEKIDNSANCTEFYFLTRLTTSGGFKWVVLFAEFNKHKVILWRGLIFNFYYTLGCFDYSTVSTKHALDCTHDYVKPSIRYLPSTKPSYSRIAVILHLYYSDLWRELSIYLSHISEHFDLFVTIPFNCSDETVTRIINDFPDVVIWHVDNRGRDILPFMEVMANISSRNYEYVCKIHSKKSPHRWDGGEWRKALIGDMLGSPIIVDNIIKSFEENPKLGLVAPWDNLTNYSALPGDNQKMVSNIAKRMDAESFPDFPFPKGSMFWARMTALAPLMSANILPEEFAPESRQMDGTIAHAIERVFGLSALKAGFTCEEAPEIISAPTQLSP